VNGTKLIVFLVIFLTICLNGAVSQNRTLVNRWTIAMEIRFAFRGRLMSLLEL